MGVGLGGVGRGGGGGICLLHQYLFKASKVTPAHFNRTIPGGPQMILKARAK